MKSCRMVYDMDFQDLPEVLENIPVDLLEGKIYRVLIYPPYNVGKDRSMDNSLRDIFTSEDKRHIEELARQIIAVGAQGRAS